MKKALLFMAGLAVAASASFASDTTAEVLYGIGEPFGGWFSDKGVEIEKVSDGVFKYEGQLAGYFSFTSALGTWDDVNGHRYGPKSGNTFSIGESEMQYGADASWNAAMGNYVVTIDTNNLKITVAEGGAMEVVTTYALHGQLSSEDWASTDLTATEGNDDEWTVTMEVSNAGSFGVKELSNGQQTNWFSAVGGYTFDADHTSVALVTEGGEDMTFGYNVPAKYKFVFVPSTQTLTVTPDGESGIASVASDNVEAKYFNLQGVQVANPENGLFIVVKGGKTSKVLVK